MDGTRTVRLEDLETGERFAAIMCARCREGRDLVWRRRWRILNVDAG